MLRWGSKNSETRSLDLVDLHPYFLDPSVLVVRLSTVSAHCFAFLGKTLPWWTWALPLGRVSRAWCIQGVRVPGCHAQDSYDSQVALSHPGKSFSQCVEITASFLTEGAQCKWLTSDISWFSERLALGEFLISLLVTCCLKAFLGSVHQRPLLISRPHLFYFRNKMVLSSLCMSVSSLHLFSYCLFFVGFSNPLHLTPPSWVRCSCFRKTHFL